MQMTLDPKILLSDEQAQLDWPLLRLEAAKRVESKPWRKWEHTWYLGDPTCPKCHKLVFDVRDESGMIHQTLIGPRKCSIPDLAIDPLEVLAEKLVKKCDKPNLDGLMLWEAIPEFWSAKYGPTDDHDQQVDDLMWFILWATPAERCFCALQALEVQP